MSVFGFYSEYYDLLYSDKDYEKESIYIGNLIKENAPSAKNILELGCGTGAHAALLARQGYQVLGIDISHSMLDKAIILKNRLDKKISNQLDFQIGDVKTYRIEKKFDVIISLFHVFSYQTRNQDLLAVFETASHHLRPGGLLIFDYWYGPAVLTQLPEVRIKRLQNERYKILRVAEPEIFPSQNIVKVDYWMIIDSLKDNHTENITESHIMRYFFLPEIEAFSLNLFNAPKHYAWLTKAEPGFADWSAVSIMERR